MAFVRPPINRLKIEGVKLFYGNRGGGGYMLAVERLYKAIDGRQIVSNVSFVVPDGELVAITGFSGSGKTTLLKCIMGIYRPDSGSISLAGN